MNQVANNYQFLIRKIDEFTCKYYINKLLGGIIYSLAFTIIFLLLVALLEYKFYFPSSIRKIFLSVFLLTNIFYWRKKVFLPLFHYYKLGKIISHYEAARIIGTHFKNIQDKLFNILQLKEQTNAANAQLIEASINQKIIELKPIPFSSAINLSENKKYLKYALTPFLILLVLFFSSPNLIRESTKRIIHSGTDFEKPALFHFQILNEKLEALQYDDFDLEVKVEGEILPNELFISQNNYDYKLEKKNKNTFQYKFNKLQKNVLFALSADNVRSKDYELVVLAKPMILSFEVELNYPKYLEKKNEMLKNIGDLVVPEGTKVNWKFFTQNTNEIKIGFDDEAVSPVAKNGVDDFFINRKIMKESRYAIFVSNEKIKNADSIKYAITVIPDLHPTITVNTISDSINKNNFYFLGEASDDYGLKNIFFKYQIESENNKNTETKSVSIPISRNSKNTEFNYFWDLSEMKFEPGQKLIYYFEAWDNDEVNGSKFSRTPLMTIEIPTEKEFEALSEKSNEQIKEDLQKSIDETKKLQEEMKALQEKLLQKKSADWEDKQSLKTLIEKQEQLQKKIENTQNQFNNQLSQQSQYKDVNERILEKQKQLQDIFNSALPEEMKRKMEELQQMMDKLNKKQTMDNLKNMQMTNENLEKELDRMLSLFKQLEFEAKLQETIDDMKNLAKEQNDLREKTEEKKSDSETLKKEQQGLNEKFEDIEKKMADLKKKDEELNNQNFFEQKTKQEREEIKQNMDNALNDLKQNKSKKASETQKNASEKLQETAEEMQAMMMMDEAEQAEEDLTAIRQLLENLVKLSFAQEELLNKTKSININSPQYVSLMKEQQKIKDDAKMVEDSLVELSKRVVQIESVVMTQTSEIKKNIDKGIFSLEQRAIPQTTVYQQTVMTSVNNLGVLLSEVMEKLQQKKSECKGGSCKKPGKKKSSASALSKMQKDLNAQLKQIKEGLKPGEQNKGKQGISKELAQSAAQQAAIRQALEKLNQEENKDGKGGLGNLEELAKQMEETETELLNKKITEEMLNRQQEILTRLLDAANAEKQRETEQKREAERPKEYSKKIPPSIEEYLKKREAEVDLYKTVSPNLKPYYKSLVEQYFKTISN